MSANKRRKLSTNSSDCLDSSFVSVSSLPDLIFDDGHHPRNSITSGTSTPSKAMIEVLPALVTPTRTPTIENEGLRKRRDTWGGEDSFDYDDEYEREKRQDTGCITRSGETMTRTSPRSPIAVLKLRRTNLFPEEEGKPTKPITVTYRPSEKGEPQLSSRSLASSMFLVSPLRPLARTVNAPPRVNANIDLKASLIDSSQTILRPLTPLSKLQKPKRSLSDAMLLDEIAEDSETKTKLQSTDFNTPPKLAPGASTAQASSISKQRWLIPAEHPYKVLWDVLTFVLSLANVYATHTSIRDRQFGNSWFMTFCEAWFVLDILLNFITEYRSDSYALRDCRSVWARYLTTWFVIDVLSLFPGEALYLQPIIDQQNRRGFFKKNFFRSKAVVRVTRMLRGRHFKMFGKAASHTKHVGVGASTLLRLLIKYIPKYLLFIRNMKGVLALRMLRQVHWFRKVWRNFRGLDNVNGEGKQMEAPLSLRKFRPDYDEDEDGAPF